MSHTPRRLGALVTTVAALLLLSPAGAALADDGSVTPDAGTLAVRYITTSTPTLSSTAERGARLDIFDGLGGPLLCSTTVGDDGRYSCTLSPLADGPHDLVLIATDRAGNPSKPAIFSVVVDTIVPLAPVVTGPAPDTTDLSPQPTMVGTGEPGATLVVVDQDGRTLLDTVVDDSGSWSGATAPLPDGPSTLSATQTDPAGHVSPPSAALRYTVGDPTPVADLAVTVTAPSDVEKGESFTAHVQVQNAGATPATQVQLASSVPSPFVLVSAPTTLPDLLPGESQTLEVILRAEDEGRGDLAWSVSGAELEMTEADNTATAEVVAAAPAPETGGGPKTPAPEPEPVVTEPPAVVTTQPAEEAVPLAAAERTTSGDRPAEATVTGGFRTGPAAGRASAPTALASTGAAPAQLVVVAGATVLLGAAAVLLTLRRKQG